jgi:SAM-dependent methyltransferase
MGESMFSTPADVYNRYIGRYAPSLARELISYAEVKPGDRALDVGCGPGALTAELVGVLGADQVAAVDPSEPFVVACRSRLPAVRVEVAAAETLPFEDGSFDHALAQLVVNFMTDASVGVGQMCRVTRPGGSVTAAVWDYAGEMTMLRHFWDAVVALDPTAAARDEGRMPFCTPQALAALWSTVGLSDVRTSEVVVTAAYQSFDDLWHPFELGVGPAGAYTASLPPEARRKLRRDFQRRLGVAGNPFQLTARAWMVTGTVAR